MIFQMGSKVKTGGSILLVPTDQIIPNPSQPRKTFNQNELECLASSIKNNGIIQPLVIRKKENDKYELISGERRLRAAGMVGLETVPCVLMSVSDSDSALFAIIENIQRDNLNFFEEAESIHRLMTEFNMTQDEISKKLGKSQSYFSNKIRLLKLPPDLRAVILENSLTERHARALLKLKSDVDRFKAILFIIENNLNVTETDKYIESIINPVQIKSKPKFKKLKDIKIFINTINHAVDTMRKAGIKADSEKHETSEYLEYVIRIEKLTSSPVDFAQYSGNAV
ncbi:MAG: ParB/RepB/Spo0J family partition protein [Clostridia bacterium]|nr:ParB/RepB/Spo0J family partition protein [Clostridia bacterium]